MTSNVSKNRLSLITGLGVLLWSILGLRLVFVQIYKGDFYEQRAADQHRRTITIPPNRGRIFDRDLRTLAMNINVRSYGMKSSDIAKIKRVDLQRLSEQIARHTGQKPGSVWERMTYPSGNFKYLARGVEHRESTKVESLQVFSAHRDLIQVERDVRRAYPYEDVAGQIEGNTNVDREGVAGVELTYHQLLQGSQGISVVRLDGRGRQYARMNALHNPPLDGADIILTIDAATQAIAEEVLDSTVSRHGALGGMIIIMQPSTGEILALASNPPYDPNDPGSYEVAAQKMRPVVNMYEPGSTFKLVAATAALDTDAFTEDDIIHTQYGKITVGGQVIEDHEKFSSLSFRGVIEHSSNVGTIKIAQAVGDYTMFKYARAYGFGSPTGIGLPGEASGVLKNPMDWSATSLPTMAIGYGVSVTGLQLVNAYCAVANDGVLMEPRIIKAIVSPDGSIRRNAPVSVRRVMSSATAATMRDIFQGVVSSGTGRKAAVDGFRAGGKTGTAWKVREDGPGYTRNYRSSFAGIFPADNPEVVVLIVIDEPKKDGFYGGDVAAPAFSALMKRLVNQPGGPIETAPRWDSDVPRYLAHLQESGTRFVPDEALYGLNIQEAMGTSNKAGIQVLQLPDLEYRRHAPGKPAGILEPARPLPRVLGLSIREAMRRLAPHRIEPVVIGNGIVVRQIPEAGKPVKPGSTCLIECRPYAAMAFSPDEEIDN